MKPKFGVIASVMEPTVSGLISALHASRQVQTCEIRLDPLRRQFKTFAPTLEKCLSVLLINQKVILTLRSKEQGGHETITAENQWDFWYNLPRDIKIHIQRKNSNVFVDWGYDLVSYTEQKSHLRKIFPWEKIGVSLHNFERTPIDVAALLGQLQKTKAQAFIKLVTMIRDQTGDIPRLKALFKQRTDKRPLISFGMGKLGEVSRFECLGWGSAGTYGHNPNRTPSAPGQVSISQLMSDRHIQAALVE